MTKLSSDDKDQLLIRLLSQGRGSLEFARNILTGSDDIDPPSPQPSKIYLKLGVLVVSAGECRMNRKTSVAKRGRV